MTRKHVYITLLHVFLFTPLYFPIQTEGLSLGIRRQPKPIPINDQTWPNRLPAQNHCSKCGLCETSFVQNVTSSCAFLGPGMARMDESEVQVHGRKRNLNCLQKQDYNKDGDGGAEEGRFGVLNGPIRLVKGIEKDAQWTGVVTGIALAMLETKRVNAVVCIASQEDATSGGGTSWSEPKPILARTKEEVLRGRGVKPALAPSLQVLDEIKNDESIRKLLFCGVGCSVQAFRSIQHDLGLEEVYVLGTNCADNSPSPRAAREFLREGLQVDEQNVKGYEFMQDFRVHVKGGSNEYTKKPYFCLPGKVADSAIADSCLACFDYTNGLADVVVGYMGAPLDKSGRMDSSYQTLTCRNERGSEMIDVALRAGRLNIYEEAKGSGTHEKFATATVASDSIVLAMTGGDVKQKGMPILLGELMATVMSSLGPKGINFARYSIDYHLLRNYLHILDSWGEERAKNALPLYCKTIIDHYRISDDSFRNLENIVLQKKLKRKR